MESQLKSKKKSSIKFRCKSFYFDLKRIKTIREDKA